jgi:hypothetical protein
MAERECPHEHLKPEVVDQTLGVACLDCDELLYYCWGSEHVPESIWNRACESGRSCRPCEQSRDDRCAICHRACALKKE